MEKDLSLDQRMKMLLENYSSVNLGNAALEIIEVGNAKGMLPEMITALEQHWEKILSHAWAEESYAKNATTKHFLFIKRGSWHHTLAKKSLLNEIPGKQLRGFFFFMSH